MLAEQFNSSFSWFEQAEHHGQSGRLTRPVRAENRYNGAFGDVKGDVVHGLLIFKRLGDMVHFDNCVCVHIGFASLSRSFNCYLNDKEMRQPSLVWTVTS
ncbi:hypothetical protein D3C77_614760 [compost metagenome]